MSIIPNCRAPDAGQTEPSTSRCRTGCECAASVMALKDGLDATIQALADRINSLESERAADARLWTETVFAKEVRNG